MVSIKHIIAITGEARSGKDTASGYLQKMYGYERFAFADPMKDILCTTLGIDLETLDAFKNNPTTHSVTGDFFYISNISSDLDYTFTEFSTDMRKILQRFGTDSMKKYFGNDVWASLLISRAHLWGCSKVVVSDLRYLNEYEVLQMSCEKLTVIRIHKEGTNKNDTHSSEQELNKIPADYEISNNGSIQDLQNKLNKILSEVTNET